MFSQALRWRWAISDKEQTASLYTALLDVVDNQFVIRAKIKAARCFLIQVTATP